MPEKFGNISTGMVAKACLKDLLSDIDAPPETILMAVGWLAREGYVVMKGSSTKDCKLELRSLSAMKEGGMN